MNAGTASNKLRKIIMYHMAKKLNEHYCFQCGKEIELVEEFTLEHKIPWLDSKSPKELFFNMDNIAFSHLSCNSGAARKSNLGADTSKHGTLAKYSKGCRCENCTNAMKVWKRSRRAIINNPSVS